MQGKKFTKKKLTGWAAIGFMIIMGILSMLMQEYKDSVPLEVTAKILTTLVETEGMEFVDDSNFTEDRNTVENSSLTNDLRVHYIDVGQGDATLITNGEHAMLIDAGDNNMGTAVQLYLTKQGIGKEIVLDYVVGTHPDADHIGGLDVIISKFEIGTILLSEYEKDTKTYQDVRNEMEYGGYKKTRPVVGASYSLGEAEVTIIAPNRNDYASVNDGSIGILVEHGRNRFLFMGDGEIAAEEDLLQNGIDISGIDVYKVSHHGSDTATTEDFLMEMDPEYAVISVGEDNTYGHPRAEVLNRLRAEGVKVFRTDEQGSLIAVSDGKKVTFNASPTESWQSGETGIPE